MKPGKGEASSPTLNPRGGHLESHRECDKRLIEQMGHIGGYSGHSTPGCSLTLPMGGNTVPVTPEMEDHEVKGILGLSQLLAHLDYTAAEIMNSAGLDDPLFFSEPEMSDYLMGRGVMCSPQKCVQIK